MNYFSLLSLAHNTTAGCIYDFRISVSGTVDFYYLKQVASNKESLKNK